MEIDCGVWASRSRGVGDWCIRMSLVCLIYPRGVGNYPGAFLEYSQVVYTKQYL